VNGSDIKQSFVESCQYYEMCKIIMIYDFVLKMKVYHYLLLFLREIR
jgi:hypothetical protein